MERVMNVLNGSLLWRVLVAICDWFGRQWQSSGVVQWFLNPTGWGAAASEGSVFFKLWALILRGLSRLYELLRLEHLFRGSVFLRPWVWCAIPVILAPMLDFFRPSLMIFG
ncbi:MAG: hypothetical protein IKK44_04805, partial [Clostridium sp.]|nr:hypothetical protein [Clostridium sp.]